MDLSTTEGFLAARADWKAQGCPTNHPYLLGELPKAGPIVPLVDGITPEMVAAASAMGLQAQSDSNVRSLVSRGR